MHSLKDIIIIIIIIIRLLLLINNDLRVDIELNKERRYTKLIARCFGDIFSSLSSDRKNSVLKFKGANSFALRESL